MLDGNRLCGIYTNACNKLCNDFILGGNMKNWDIGDWVELMFYLIFIFVVMVLMALGIYFCFWLNAQVGG